MKSRFLCAQCKKDAVGTVPKYLGTKVVPGSGWYTTKEGKRVLNKTVRKVSRRWLHPGECNDTWFQRYREYEARRV